MGVYPFELDDSYPANAKPGIVLDENGVCSGCRAFEAKTVFLNKMDHNQGCGAGCAHATCAQPRPAKSFGKI